MYLAQAAVDINGWDPDTRRHDTQTTTILWIWKKGPRRRRRRRRRKGGVLLLLSSSSFFTYYFLFILLSTRFLVPDTEEEEAIYTYFFVCKQKKQGRKEEIGRTEDGRHTHTTHTFIKAKTSFLLILSHLFPLSSLSLSLSRIFNTLFLLLIQPNKKQRVVMVMVLLFPWFSWERQKSNLNPSVPPSATFAFVRKTPLHFH